MVARYLIAFLCILLAGPVWAGEALNLNLPNIGDPSRDVLSASQEKLLGKRYMDEIRRDMPLMSNPEVVEYVNEIGQRLVTHCDAPDYGFHFFVVDSSEVNAFAMPGGYIGVNSALLLAADNENELAAVMAHEIAHVTQHHIARTFAEARKMDIRTGALLLASVLVGLKNPQAGSAAAVTSMAGSAQHQLAFSREHEREADRIGMSTLEAAGFNPQGMPDFFEKLMREDRYQAQPPAWLVDHPLTQSRIADAEARASSYPKHPYHTSGEFPFVKAQVRVLDSSDPAKAVNYFKNSLSDAKGENIEVARYGLALALDAANDHARAEKLLRELLKKRADFIPYLVAAAKVQRNAGQLQQSLKTSREGLSLYPDDYALNVGYAQTLMEAQKPREAQQVLSALLENHRNDPMLYHLQAQAAGAAGNIVEGQLSMAGYYHALGDIPSALQQLHAVLKEPQADNYQKSRAAAMQTQWRREQKEAKDKD